MGDELGVNPETLRGWVRQARIDAGDRPGTTTEGARRIKELEKEVRELRRANAILRSASAILLWQSVSAHRADLRLHRGPEGGVRGRADLHRPDRVRVQDRPVHLLRRPVPPALEEVGVRRRRGREDPRPEGRAVQRGTRVEEDLAAAQRPAGGPRGGPVHRGAAHAGAGTDRRRAGQDGARHRARRGGPGPRRPAAPRLPPPPARTADGWSTCAHVPTWSGYSLHGVRHGPVLPPDRRLGHQQPHGHRLRARRPGAGDLAAQGTRGRGPGGAGAPLRPRIQVTCPSPTPDDSSTRASRHRPEPWVPPTTTPPPRPWASPTSASSSGATAPGRDAPTPATATARWVDWYNRTRPHLTNDDDLPHTTVEHRYNHNHTTTPPTTV